MKQKLQQLRDSLLEKVPHKNYTPVQKTALIKKIAACGCVLAVLILMLIAVALFPVSEIEVVSNQSHYTNAEIVESLDAAGWTPMLSLLPGKAEQRILNELLYLDAVEVSYSFPATLYISVHEQQPLYYFYYETQISGKDHNGWLAVGPDLRVVDAARTGDDFAARGMTKLSLPAPVLDQTKPGRNSTLRFTRDKETGENAKTEQDFAYISEFLAYLEGSSIAENLTSVDLAEKFEVAVTLDGKYRIEFGRVRNAQEFAQKLELAEMMIARGVANSDMKFIVCVGVDEPYLRPAGDDELN